MIFRIFNLLCSSLVTLVLIGCTNPSDRVTRPDSEKQFIDVIDQAKEDQRHCWFKDQRPSMGTFLSLEIEGPCNTESRSDLLLEIQNTLDLIESHQSLYQTSSEVSLLNKHGFIEKPSEDLVKTLGLALEIGQKTNWHFDVSIWPVLLQIQKSFAQENHKPSDKSLDQMRNLVDGKKVIINKQRNRISFENPKMGITLDGIAKGFAVDQVVDILLKKNINNFLVNFSGNMRVHGHSPTNNYWKIALSNPLNSTQQNISITAAIASSGRENNYYSEDKSWHHIINPKTLRPTNIWVRSTAIGPSAGVCDALSTALYVMNAQTIKTIMAKHFPEYKYWMVSAKDGSVFTNL